MTFLPLIGRELRTRARSRTTYWMRFAVGLVGVLICLPEPFVSGPFGTPIGTGKQLFNGIVVAAFALSCCTCLLAADAISAERREGTLGLLFLTRVKTLDVLVGKLGSLGISSLCALVTFFPVLMIPVLAGGVGGGEAFRKGLALLTTLWLALAAGLCGSAVQQDRFKATRNALLILVGVMLVPPMFAVGAKHAVLDYVAAASPLVLVQSATDAAYALSPGSYWLSLVAVQLVAALLLLATGVGLRRAMQGAAGDAAAGRPPAPPKEPEDVQALVRWQPDKDEVNPVEWLVHRHRGLSGFPWAMAVLGPAYGAWVFLAHELALPGLAHSWVFAWPLGVAASLVGGALVAWVASRFFVGVRQTGELELVMTTPLGAEAMVPAQWNVLKRFFVMPTLMMQGALLIPMLTGGTMQGGNRLGWGLQQTLTLGLGFANAYFGTVALCRLGMWYGLKARGQVGAILWTVTFAKGIPCLLTLMLATLLDPAGTLRAAPPPFLWWLAEVPLLGFYLWLSEFSQRRVQTDLAGVDLQPGAGQGRAQWRNRK